jgi:hypothetical protein
MKHQAHIVHKIPVEDPVYSSLRPEKPELANSQGGTTRHGSEINGSYQQPWIHHDGVIDSTGDEKIG